MAAEWLADCARVGVAAVARELGMRPGRSGWGPCPACGVETRGDSRAPIGVRGDDRGWRCHRCGAGGSAVDLVCWSVGGSRELHPGVRAWYAAHGWCEGRAEDPPVVRRPPPPPEPEAPKARPEGIAEWYSSLPPIPTDREAYAWLQSRGRLAEAVTDLDLARVIPRGPRPWWCARSQDHRVVVPQYDAAGALVYCRVRRVAGSEGRKSLGPKGDGSGVVFANEPGRRILRRPERATRIEIVEGEMDYLTRAVESPDTPILGLGHWTQAIADRIPYGARVEIWTHWDDAGTAYARGITATLRDRGTVLRARRVS